MVRKLLVVLTVMVIAGVILAPYTFAQERPVVRSSWGAIKALYRGSTVNPSEVQQAEPSQLGVKKPGVEPMASSRFSWGWCTWYAATEFDKVAPAPDCNWGGNAAQWWNNAVSQKWIYGGRYIHWVCLNGSVTDAAALNIPNGSIVVWTDGGYGHVAVFRSWGQNGIHVQEMNWVGFGTVSSAFLTWPQVANRGGYRFVGYITPRQAVAW